MAQPTSQAAWQPAMSDKPLQGEATSSEQKFQAAAPTLMLQPLVVSSDPQKHGQKVLPTWPLEPLYFSCMGASRVFAATSHQVRKTTYKAN